MAGATSSQDDREDGTRRRVPAVHPPRLRRHLRRSTRRTSPARSAATCSTSSTTGTGCRSRAASRDFEAKWADRLDPLNFSGVWRFRELLPFAPPDMVVTIGEGQTLLQTADKVGQYVGLAAGSLLLQYEGMNPSGSFKDNGMTAAFTHARMVGARRVACASTGNTSAALAVYCSATDLGFRAIIFIGSGKIAYGKLAQALDHGALTIQIVGDFDDAMQRVRQVADRLGIYLMNSINPFRLEGQKTIMFRVLEGLGWEVPDWIVVPGGNLGNSSAFGKAFIELKHLGLIDRVPRLAVINATGARTLDELVGHRGLTWRNGLPEMDRIERLLRPARRRARSRPRRSPRPSRSTAR